MIREPYGVVPYNGTVDTTIDNEFSVIFNGDELESYQYEIYENNSGAAPIYKSTIIDNPTIYNGDIISIITEGEQLKETIGKNLLWKLTFWENNAFYKLIDYKEISRSSTESEPNKIYLQDENNLFNNINWEDKNIIVNIIIRNERKRVLKYNSEDNSVEISSPFSFIPSRGGYIDKYILYGNFNGSFDESTIVPATIPVMNGITIDISKINPEITNDIISTGVIPVLENITDQRLQNEVVVNLDFGNNQIYRILEYWKWEVLYDIEKSKIEDDIQYYNVTINKTLYHEGQSSTYTNKIENITDVSWYQEHDGDLGAYCKINKTLLEQLPVGSSYSVYRNYYDTNLYFFKSRKTAILKIDNFPTEEANTFPSRYYNFQASYQQENNIPIKYHIWEVYDINKTKAIYSTDKIFNSNLNFSYDNFENNHTYKIKLTVVNQENATAEFISPNLIILYEDVDLKTSGEASYDSKTYSSKISWPDNRLAIPVLVDGADGTFNYFFDAIKQEKKNLALSQNTTYKYNNLSGTDFNIDSSNFLFSTFIAINSPNLDLWSGEILNLSSSPSGNKISLVKDGYELKILCSDEKENNIYYNFYRAQKLAGNNYLKSKEKFSLLEVKSGQQAVKLEDGSYRPLKDEEKLGYAYSWLEEQDGNKILWNDNYYWTETISDTNNYVYKLLIYPDRAELYPMLRWYGEVLSVEENKIEIGFNRLLSNRKNKTLIEINGEIKEILDYDLSTEIATIDSSFNSVSIGDKFLCYYENAENSTKDNLFLCEFTRANNIPFNQILFSGDLYYNYLILFTKNDFSDNEIHDMLDYYYHLEWNNNNQNYILINCDFNNSLISQYYEGITTQINGYRIYRNTFKNESDLIPLESILIAELDYTDLEKINKNGYYTINDYSVRNRGIFNYSILPLTDTVVGARIETNKIKTDWYEWIFTSIGQVKNNIYRPLEQWIFKLNINASEVRHNVNKVFHQGLSKYPKVSIGRTNYITTSLNCLISELNYESIYQENYLLKVLSGKIKYNTLDSNNLKIYIGETSIFDDINLQNKEAYIFINNQQRRITYYGSETGFDGITKYYILIEEPFKYFIPNLEYENTSNFVIYTNYLPKNYDSSNIIKEKNIFFEDSIERITAWNKFISTENPILIRDMKGNSFIGIISNNSELSDINIDAFPTTISFEITQIADINDYLIFSLED